MKQERYQRWDTSTAEAKLFGDYDLIVDVALNGDAKLKRRIAEADAIDRGGLAVLKNALRNRQVILPPKLVEVMQSCEADQAYYAELQQDFANIDKHGNFYRVRLTIGSERMTKSFKSLRKAQVWRDRLALLGDGSDLNTYDGHLDQY